MQNNFYFIGTYSNIYKKPSSYSEVTSQILYGEKFKIISKKKNWVKVKTISDNYVGYVKNLRIIDNFYPSYKVYNLKEKKKKKPNLGTNKWLSFGSKLPVMEENKKFIKIERNKWIKKKDIKKIDHIEKNFIKVFKKFLNIKYKWGGKTYKGIDCSALLQIFFVYNNSFYPRDTKDQIKYSKGNLKKKKFQRGDVIFWKGHVAVCLNSKKLIHAYGPERKVIIMPIIKTINRIQKTAKLKVIKVSKINY